MEEFLNVLDRSDMVLVRGIGQLTDSFLDSAARLLRTLRQAQCLGKLTAMTGQGIGPITHPGLRELARQVLPRVDLIALREGRVGPGLLASLGVPAERIVVTGDDAIEPANRLAPPELGNGLGVNMRVAEYAGVASGDEAVLRGVLHAFAQLHGVPLIPVPISRNEHENDFGTIARLIDGAPPAAPDWKAIDEPLAVCRLAGRCRVVVTGSYHAGVFALSQGASVVGLAKSDYYRDKFEGLAHQFGGGCTLVDLGKPDLQRRLADALAQAWADAPAKREQLLAAAKTQIEAGLAAFRRVAELAGKGRAAA
jgi:colanic acid/amylovoran biosynthesis protein